jgi:hypothetical protein
VEGSSATVSSEEDSAEAETDLVSAPESVVDSLFAAGLLQAMADDIIAIDKIQLITRLNFIDYHLSLFR